MKCEQVSIHQTGGPEALIYEEVELPPLKPGQALVRQTAIGLNFIDTYHRSGLYPLPQLPHAIGTEAAGVVEELGPGVSGLKLGQRVAYVSGPPGAYANLRAYSAEHLIPLPDDVDDETAAAVMLKGMTAEYLIHRTYRVSPEELVLFHAVSGGVGSLACQWLSALGARVIGTVGTPEKADLAKKHGCEFPVVYTHEDFVAAVSTITNGRGLKVVYDSVGKLTFARSLDCLAPRGLMVSFGNASGKPNPLDVTTLATKGSLFLTRPSLFDYIRTRGELLGSANQVFEALRNRDIRPEIGQRYALKDAARAHRDLEARKTVGSSLLIP